MEPRTDRAIVLFPTGNAQGSIWYYNLRTRGIVSRDHATNATNVIEQLNSIAASEPQQTSSGLEFNLGHLAKEDLDQSTSSSNGRLLSSRSPSTFGPYIRRPGY
jgi:hypothetical protein